MLEDLIKLSILLSIFISYAMCTLNNQQKSQIKSLNERINEIIDTINYSPLLPKLNSASSSSTSASSSPEYTSIPSYETPYPQTFSLPGVPSILPQPMMYFPPPTPQGPMTVAISPPTSVSPPALSISPTSYRSKDKGLQPVDYNPQTFPSSRMIYPYYEPYPYTYAPPFSTVIYPNPPSRYPPSCIPYSPVTQSYPLTTQNTLPPSNIYSPSLYAAPFASNSYSRTQSLPPFLHPSSIPYSPSTPPCPPKPCDVNYSYSSEYFPTSNPSDPNSYNSISTPTSSPSYFPPAPTNSQSSSYQSINSYPSRSEVTSSSY